nr:hypothetical protein [Tanacetum cinerariifolium]
MDASEVPEMDPYEEVSQQGHASPLSLAYVPDPMKLEHHVPVYVPEPVKYSVEDPIDYAADAGDDEDKEKESFEDDGDEGEEHLAPADSTAVTSPAVDPEKESFEDDGDEGEEHLAPANSIAVTSPAVDPVPSTEETEPFETDESTATPPPPPAYRTTSRMSVLSQAPIPLPSEAEVARLLALPTPPPSSLTPLSSPLPQIPSSPLPVPSPPTTSPTYAEYLWVMEQPRFKLTFLRMTYRLKRGYYLLLPHLGLRLGRVLLLLPDSQDLIWESEEFYTRHQDAQRDRVALRDEVDTLRRYLSSVCTTHEHERVEARQALARSEAHNRALEARIAVLETQAYRHE